MAELKKQTEFKLYKRDSVFFDQNTAPVNIAYAKEVNDVAILPLLVLILAGGEPALDEHEAPLGKVLRTGFGLPVPEDDLVPFRLVDLLAPVDGVALIRSHVQAAYGLSGLGVAHLGIAPAPSDDHHLVEAAHTITC